MVGFPWVAMTLPRLRALGLKPSTFNLSGWLPPPPITAANNRITVKVMPLTAAQQPNNRITVKVMPTNRNAVAK